MLRHWRALGFLLLFTAGCLDPQMRAQMAEEEEKQRDLEVTTVVDVTEIDDDGLMRVQGVGLVTGLAGTGHCPAGDFRNMLEQYLLARLGHADGRLTAENVHVKVRKILDDPDNAMVFVTGYIPVGGRRGDHFDVEITVPAESRTTSLMGGNLELCVLRVYERLANLTNDPIKKQSGTMLPGHAFAHAKGPLMLGFGGDSDAKEVLRARVWQGGTLRVDRPYVFRLRKDEQSIKIANAVAERINFLYQDKPQSRQLLTSGLNKGLITDQQKQLLLMENVTEQINHTRDPNQFPNDNIARATKEHTVQLRVPDAYRLDHERFLRVARLTPLAPNDPGINRYRARLQKMLADPYETVRAAIRLEALGRESIPLLTPALKHEHPFVRFAAAEALTYLGSTAGVETLVQLAGQYPVLVKNCTIALATLRESFAAEQLKTLLTGRDPAVACAAFHALTLNDEDERYLNGVSLNGTCNLYRISQAEMPIVYFATSKKTQVVIMGRDVRLTPQTPMLIGMNKEYTVVPESPSAASDPQESRSPPGACKLRITRFANGAEELRVCENRLDLVLATLSGLGASYADMIDFLRDAQEKQSVNCPIVAFAFPEVTLKTLLQEGPALK